MENFNLLAQTWDSDPRRIERANIIAREILRVIPGSDQQTAMEFGCGTGLLSFCLQPHFRHITLVDSAEGMISVVREKVEKAQFQNFSPLCTDLFTEKIDLKFDVIYTLLALHHVLDTERILEIFRDMLNPSGILCIADLDEEDGSFHGPGFNGHNGFNRDSLVRKMQHLGFSHIKHGICYQNKKTFGDGSIRYYPIFLLTGQKQ